MEEQSKQFLPRPYQIELYEKALQSNTIIYLPTGSGKTFIATMLIKKLSADTQKPYSEGGKRTVFAVNTVPLVTQQSKYVARHTGLSCKGYSGNTNVNLWCKKIWLQELEKYQVLVMTSQILLDTICHAYLPLNRINLIIFDECHRGTNDHPMRQIMQRFEEYPQNEQPKVLALSATLFNSNVKLEEITDTIKSLKVTFQSKIATASNVQGYSTNPKEVLIYYETYIQPESLFNAVKNLNYLLELLNHVIIQNSLAVNESSKVFKPRSTNSKLQSLIQDVIEHVDIAGLYGFNICLLLHIIQLESKKKYSNDQSTIYVLEHIITEFIKLRKFLHDEMKDYTEKEKIFQFSSDHVLKLLTLLKNFNDEKLPDEEFCCIIFVKRRFTASVLYHILQEAYTFDEKYKFLTPDYIVGYSNNNPYKNTKEVSSIPKWNSEVLHRFKNGLSNCLIATEVLDEGVDIPNCTLVVRFDLPPDFRSYIQSKGRSRYSTSQFAIMLNKNDRAYLQKQEQFKKIDFLLHQTLSENTDISEMPTEEDIENSLYQYVIEPYKITKNDGTQCILTEQATVSLINRYNATLLKSKCSTISPIWKLHKINSRRTMYQVFLTLPNASPLKETIVGDPMPNVDLAKRSAAFKACIRLHEIGELKDNLLPGTTSPESSYIFPD